MAHELQFTNGTADCFTVGETAWHREGHELSTAPSYDEAMALAHLDYEVKKERTFRMVGGSFAPNDLAFITTRTDSGLELGSVGPDYTVVQNRDAFKVLRPLLDEGLVSLETGGVIRNGADAWLMNRWNLDKLGPLCREVMPELGVQPFGLLAVNHSGRRGIMLAQTPVRVVCANTLGMAEQDGVSRSIVVRHTGDAEAKLVEAAHALWGSVIQRYEVVAQQYRTLKGLFLDEAMFRELVVDAALTDPRTAPKFNPEAKLAEMVVARYERKVQAVTGLWTAGKGHTGDHSAWEAYNAIVEAVDHNPDLFPTRGGTYRTAALLDGKLAQMKHIVLSNLLALAA